MTFVCSRASTPARRSRQQPLWRLLALACSAAACASRSTPIRYPANAPSSAQAPEAKVANVTRSLSDDPAAATLKSGTEPGQPENQVDHAQMDHSQHGGHVHGAH